MDQIRFKSFNCYGAISKLPIIFDLCRDADVVFLQETWLTVPDLHFFEKLGDNFGSYSISSVDNEELSAGRPHGGLTIIWRKSIEHICTIVNFEDPRCLGLKLCSLGRNVLAINVYLPYYTADNFDEYNHYIGKISSIVEEADAGEVIILGDFNSCIGNIILNNGNVSAKNMVPCSLM